MDGWRGWDAERRWRVDNVVDLWFEYIYNKMKVKLKELGKKTLHRSNGASRNYQQTDVIKGIPITIFYPIFVSCLPLFLRLDRITVSDKMRVCFV